MLFYFLIMAMSVLAQVCVQDSLHLENEIASRLRLNQNHGFPFASVQMEASDSCASRWRLVDISGEGYVWAGVRRLGEGITREDLLTRMSLLKPGEPVALGNLERSRRLLARSGWFADVGKVRLFRESDRNRLIPAFPIEEFANNQVEVLVAYQSDANKSEDAPWSGRVLVDLQNIAGSGRALYVIGQTGSVERSAEFRYREPYPWGIDYILQMNAGMWQLDSTQSHLWSELAISQQINWEWNFTAAGGQSNIREDSLQSETRWGRITALRDDRDRLPLPRTGWMASGEIKGGTRTWTDFAQTGAQLGIWIPIRSKWTWANEWESSALWPRQERYLQPELLSLGGVHLRGYWPGSIRTTDYSLWTSSLQWIDLRSLAEVFVEGAVVERSRFVSYGVGWEQQKTGVGVTVRLAWSKNAAPLEALLSLGVKTRF
jgi:hypothetical protein